eukprot:g11564.t1
MSKSDEYKPNARQAALQHKLQTENDASVEAVLALIESDGWAIVASKPGVTVFRTFVQPTPSFSTNCDRDGRNNTSQADGDGGISRSSCYEGQSVADQKAAAKFACMKVVGTIDANADDVYELFRDNERVHEYNENCVEIRDLEWLSSDTKISWSATRRVGPLQARDFVTVVHYRNLEDGTKIVINRPAEHPDARPGKTYVRAQILRAANIMRPNAQDPTKTDFINVMHINPGGVADSWLGAMVVNRLCGMGVDTLRALEAAANRPAPTRKS